MFCCRSSVICRWRCWKRYWWGRSWCCMPKTMRLMTTAGHRSLVNAVRLRDELSLACPQSAAAGTRLWLDGRSHQLRAGSHISWSSLLNVSGRIRTQHRLLKIPVGLIIFRANIYTCPSCFLGYLI